MSFPSVKEMKYKNNIIFEVVFQARFPEILKISNGEPFDFQDFLRKNGYPEIKTNMDAIPEELRQVYRTVWEIPMKGLIDLAAARGPYIDQSQSLNLFVESPNIGKLSSMYYYAWKKGVKTTYYMRSRPATKIAKVTTGPTPKPVTGAEAVACSLENPESCESCQ